MNKILLFTLLAAVIIVGTLQLGNLTFAQTPPPIKEKIIRPVDVGPTDLWGYSSSISSSKVDAVTDNPPTPSTTYITSNVNNQGQNLEHFQRHIQKILQIIKIGLKRDLILLLLVGNKQQLQSHHLSLMRR